VEDGRITCVRAVAVRGREEREEIRERGRREERGEGSQRPSTYVGFSSPITRAEAKFFIFSNANGKRGFCLHQARGKRLCSGSHQSLHKSKELKGA